MEDWSAVERRPLRCRPVLGQARSVKSRGSYGLRWTEVDLEAQTISIEITRVVVDGEVVEGGTKSETSTRVLPLIPELLAALRAAARMQAEEQLAAGPPASAAATWSSTLWGGATTPRRCRTTGRPRLRRRASSASGYTTPGTPAARSCTWSTTCRWGGHRFGHGTRWNRCEQAGRGEIAWTAERR